MRSTSPQRRPTYSILDKVRNGTWAFCKGFADSLRGAVELFFLDYRASQQREKKLVQRDIDRELILNRESPSREIQNIAKKRALKRREQERIKAQASGNGEKKEPRILERTLKCCLLNGCVFWSSILIFENVVLPLVQWMLSWVLRGERADAVWMYTQPILSMAFSTLWVLPFYLLSQIVNAIWFKDIADLAFRSSKGRPVATLSISVMISDTVFTIVVEMIFLVQGSLAALLPIKILGAALNHLCLLHSLYSFLVQVVLPGPVSPQEVGVHGEQLAVLPRLWSPSSRPHQHASEHCGFWVRFLHPVPAVYSFGQLSLYRAFPRHPGPQHLRSHHQNQ